ncbi:MAG: RecQ family ATP-dependent DNA helicase [Bacteroidia bacterium]|nr:RecQ family ATP-dependent DNA helicase [Bacteroidia bacterium]
MKSPLEVLQQYWGYPSFRSPQDEIIQSVLEGNDTLALLPTGGGKSICFQVPGLCLDGLTLVISPLIALMKDQVERLNQLGIPATYINSGLDYHKIDSRLQAAMDGAYKFLYVAPERLGSEMFRLRLPKMNVSLLAVDEAHCISQWGYDFRPAYLKIADIKELKPNLPVIALTASATPMVKQDILEKLQIDEAKVFSKSFKRENLRYFVLEEENIRSRILDICKRTTGTGIIYARTRRLTEHLAQILQQQQISAAAYHGGLKMSQRSEIQQAWLNNNIRIVCATNAFGMGIDKPDVRFVIHHNLPFDLESYYQEAGRGGRDGKQALAISFKNPVDLSDLQKWSKSKYPSWELLVRHYKMLCDFFHVPNQGKVDSVHSFNIRELASNTGESSISLYASLKILHNENLLDYNEDTDDFSYVQVIASPEALIFFKQNQPRLADFVDFFLRNTGGEVYSQEVRFLLDDWGRKMRTPPLEIHHNLKRLEKLDLIQYKPASGEPSIRFLLPRHQLNPKQLNWEKYAFLKAQQDDRLKEMLNYVENTKLCRSLIIQHYFGEKDHQPCGKCDVCIGRQKEKVNNQEFKEIFHQIQKLLKENSSTYRYIIQDLDIGSPAQREKVLRYMLDKKLIHADGRGNIRLLKKTDS